MTWYYVAGEERVGPISDTQIDKLIARGVITSDTLVWREGMAEWIEAGQSELSAQLNQKASTAPEPATIVLPQQAEEPSQDEEARHIVQGTPYTVESMRSLWTWMVWLAGLGIPLIVIGVGVFAVLGAVVLGYILLYRFWALIQDGQARTTPGLAVGLCFIPFYNIYWVYVAYIGLAKDMNAYCAERNIEGVPVNEQLVLIWYILVLVSWIPTIGIFSSLASIVLYILFMKQFTDLAVHIIEFKSLR